MPVLVRPKWCNAEAYAKALGQPPTIQAVVLYMRDLFFTESGPLSTADVAPEIDPSLPDLINELRILDLSSPKYWITMFLATLLFCIVETIFADLFGLRALVATFLFVTFMACFLMSWYAWELIRFFTQGASYRPVLGVTPEQVTTIPTVGLAGLLAGANFYLVGVTGWNSSPMLPGLLGILLVIMSLPRENSVPVLAIWPVMIVFGTIALLTSQESSLSASQAGYANVLNLLIFIYSGTLTYILRHIGTWKIAS